MLGCQGSLDQTMGGFIKYPGTASLPWRERLQEWARWTMAIPKEDDVKQPKETHKPINSQDGTIRDTKSDALALPAIDAKTQYTSEAKTRYEAMSEDPASSWSKTYETESSALLGSILHSHMRSGQSPDLTSKLYDTRARRTHTFSPTVPGLSGLLSQCEVVKQDPKNASIAEMIVLRFQPNPWSLKWPSQTAIGSQALSAFPPIEIRLAVDQKTKDLSLKDVKAIVKMENADLMLPDCEADIRYQQRTVSQLKIEAGRALPSIMKFLGDSSLNITTGRRIATPGNLVLPIPVHLCQAPGLSILGDATAHVQDVEYLFAGLEHTSTVAMRFQKFRVHYTSIEAGNANGRRGELRLLPIIHRGRSIKKEGAEKAFIACAKELAAALGTGTAVPRKVLNKKVRFVEAKNMPEQQVFTHFARRPDVWIDLPDEVLDESKGLKEKAEEEGGNENYEVEDLEDPFDRR